MKECDCCHLLNPDEAIECEYCEGVIPTNPTPLQAAVDHWEKRLKEVESHPLSLHWSNTITAKDLRLFVDATKQLSIRDAECDSICKKLITANEQLEALQAENEGLKRDIKLILSELLGAYTGLMLHPSTIDGAGFCISPLSKEKLKIIQEIISHYEQL